MNAPPCVKPGQPLNPCARTVQRQEIDGWIDLPAEDWQGWKIRNGWLIGPGGMRFNARSLRGVWLREKAVLRGAMVDDVPSKVIERNTVEARPAI